MLNLFKKIAKRLKGFPVLHYRDRLNKWGGSRNSGNETTEARLVIRRRRSLQAKATSYILVVLRFFLPPTKEEVYVFARTPELVCLSVYLSVCKITQKRVHGFG